LDGLRDIPEPDEKDVGDNRPDEHSPESRENGAAPPAQAEGGDPMTREEFFLDVAEMLRLLGRLGAHAAVEAERAGKLEAMKGGAAGITPADVLGYMNAIDWTKQDDPRLLADLARVLLRLVAGLGSEVRALAAGGDDRDPSWARADRQP
jgi:hypothetical protein